MLSQDECNARGDLHRDPPRVYSKPSALDERGDLTFDAAKRIERLIHRSTDPLALFDRLVDRCGLPRADLTKLIDGVAPVANADGRRILRAIEAEEDRSTETASIDGGFLAGGFLSGGTGENDEYDAQLDDIVALAHSLPDEPATAETEPEQKQETAPQADATPEPLAEIEPEPEIEPVDEAEPDPVAETEPRTLIEHEEVERLRKAKRKAKRDAEAKAKLRLKPAGKGKHDDARIARAAAANAGMVSKPRPRNLSEIRPELRVLRRQMKARENALANARTYNTNAFVRQVARDPVDVSRWWLAIAVARLLFGPDATLAEVAETRWRLDKRDHLVDDDTPIADRPTRRQARTAIERTLKLEQKGKPWQRYSTL